MSATSACKVAGHIHAVKLRQTIVGGGAVLCGDHTEGTSHEARSGASDPDEVIVELPLKERRDSNVRPRVS